jgi:nucleoside-diphosphate-sugar epimerase
MIRSDRSDRSGRSDRSSRSDRSKRSHPIESPARIVVTGSSGLLGSAIVRRLARCGWSVTGIDRQPGPFTRVVADITTRGLFDWVLEGVDAVIHAASLHVPDLGRVSDEDFRRVNVAATEQLLDAARRHRVGRVVYTGTTSVYGSAMVAPDRAVFVSEDLRPLVRDIYDATKLAAECLCREAADSRLRVTCLRVSRFFPEPPLVCLVHRLHRGIDVTDAAEAHYLALARLGPDFETFNISAQSPFGEHEAHLLAEDAGRVIARHFPDAPAVFSRLRWALPTRLDRVYVIDKAVRELGFIPQRNFRQLLDEVASGTMPMSGVGSDLRPCA